MEREVNFCFVHGSNDLYGASNVLLHDVAALLDVGHHVAVQLPSSGPLSAMLSALGCEVEYAPIPVFRRTSLGDVFRVPRLGRASVLHDADVVVANTLAVVPAMVPIAVRRRRPRIVVSIHEILPTPVGAAIARMSRAVADGALANSNASRRWFLEASGAPAAVEMAYPVAPSYRGRAVTRPARHSATKVMLAGRVNGRKGHMELASACSHLRDDGYDITLTLAGGPYHSAAHRRALESLVEYVGDRAWIEYLGELAPEDLLDQLADHDLHVVASRKESFGLVITEAWSRAVPTLAPADGGAAEATSLVDGIAYSPLRGNPVSTLESALRFVLDRPALLAPPSAQAPVSRYCTRARRLEAWDRLIATIR